MQSSWVRFGVALATFAQQKMAGTPRGALLVRCIGDGKMVMGIFGNDNYMLDDTARREVHLVRERLRQDHVQELGFGLSLDGRSWAVMVRPEEPHCQTRAGQGFQMEMFKLRLENLVERAWETASGLSTGADLPLSAEQFVR